MLSTTLLCSQINNVHGVFFLFLWKKSKKAIVLESGFNWHFFKFIFLYHISPFCDFPYKFCTKYYSGVDIKQIVPWEVQITGKRISLSSGRASYMSTLSLDIQQSFNMLQSFQWQGIGQDGSLAWPKVIAFMFLKLRGAINF